MYTKKINYLKIKNLHLSSFNSRKIVAILFIQMAATIALGSIYFSFISFRDKNNSLRQNLFNKFNIQSLRKFLEVIFLNSLFKGSQIKILKIICLLHIKDFTKNEIREIFINLEKEIHQDLFSYDNLKKINGLKKSIRYIFIDTFIELYPERIIENIELLNMEDFSEKEIRDILFKLDEKKSGLIFVKFYKFINLHKNIRKEFFKVFLKNYPNNFLDSLVILKIEDFTKEEIKEIFISLESYLGEEFFKYENLLKLNVFSSKVIYAFIDVFLDLYPKNLINNLYFLKIEQFSDKEIMYIIDKSLEKDIQEVLFNFSIFINLSKEIRKEYFYYFLKYYAKYFEEGFYFFKVHEFTNKEIKKIIFDFDKKNHEGLFNSFILANFFNNFPFEHEVVQSFINFVLAEHPELIFYFLRICYTGQDLKIYEEKIKEEIEKNNINLNLFYEKNLSIMKYFSSDFRVYLLNIFKEKLPLKGRGDLDKFKIEDFTDK